MEGDSPIYCQIIRFVKRSLAAGIVQDGEEMPSRRMLSALLGVNPNTIQKAYRMLEEEGLIVSHTGAKSYVTVPPERLEEVRAQLLEEDARKLVNALRQTGIDRKEALALIERLWDEEGGPI